MIERGPKELRVQGGVRIKMDTGPPCDTQPTKAREPTSCNEGVKGQGALRSEKWRGDTKCGASLTGMKHKPPQKLNPPNKTPK